MASHAQSSASSHRYTQPSQDDSSYILVARMDNVRNLSSILKAVQIKEVASSYGYVMHWNSL